VSVIATITRFAAESAAAGEAAGHAAEESTGIAALGIDPLAILAQAGTFLVLFWVVKKFALDKIVNTLEERRKTIDDGVRLGQKLEAEEAKLEEKIEAELRKTRAKADKIIADAEREGGEVIKAAEDKASQKVDQMLVDAHAKIDEDMQKARHELEKDILALVAEATEVIIEEKLDAKKDESLIQRALASVGVRR
jgi:F-type H+-transporting ATPase subunit b